MSWCANTSIIKCLISYEKFLYLWKKMFRLLELYTGTFFCCYCCSGCVLLERISSISRKPYLYLFNLSPPWLEVLLAIAAGVVIQFNYFMPIYVFSHNHLVTTFGQWQSDKQRVFWIIPKEIWNVSFYYAVWSSSNHDTSKPSLVSMSVCLQAFEFCWRRSQK